MSLIPREALFRSPDLCGIEISPDGNSIAYLAEHRGIMNIWVQEFGKPLTARPGTRDSKRGIYNFRWTFHPDTLIFNQDIGGDENYGLYTLNINTGQILEISPAGKATSRVVAMSHLRPVEVVVMSNSRDPKYFDYQILNLENQERTELFTNNNNFSEILFDKRLSPIVATQGTPDGSSAVFYWNSFRKDFEKKFEVPFEDNIAFAAIGTSLDSSTVYLIDCADRDKLALVKWVPATDQRVILATFENSDVQEVQLHPQTGQPLWATSEYLQQEIIFLDPEFETQFGEIQKKLQCQFSLVSMDFSTTRWVLKTRGSDRPPAYFFYDLKNKSLSGAIHTLKALVPFEGMLHPMESIEIQSRDGLKLVSYLTKARDPAVKAMVLLVHGGPWWRDFCEFNAYHQWLADRGYNVLSVNFRGSAGFGKSFVNAGNLEWGRKMHDDLIDAVNWAVEGHHADPKKIIIIGESYGGYAALTGLAISPDIFAGAVDIFGPSNLLTLLTSFPPYWETRLLRYYRRVGNPTTEDGRKLLKERSPLNYAEKIKKPLLILHGANDPRVQKGESDQIYKAMSANNLPVEYALFPDEGHGFAKAQNKLGAVAIIEDFLHKHLGGRLEPIEVHVRESSVQLITGIRQ